MDEVKRKTEIDTRLNIPISTSPVTRDRPSIAIFGLTEEENVVDFADDDDVETDTEFGNTTNITGDEETELEQEENEVSYLLPDQTAGTSTQKQPFGPEPLRNMGCGLVCEGQELRANATTPIPLKSVSVIASVVHAVAQVEITQVYKNEEQLPIEAIYIFPVDSNGAVTHFQAETRGGRVVKGVSRQNEDAKEQYKAGVRDGQTILLGREIQPDIFKVKIGYLQPGEEVKVIIGYVIEVKNEADSHAMRFFLPTTIAPRITLVDDMIGMQHTNDLVAPISIKVIASLQGKFGPIESPTHKIMVEDKGQIPEKPSWNKVIITVMEDEFKMNRDFVLLITPEESMTPRLYLEHDCSGSKVLMTHFVPKFKLDEQKIELVIVVDRSSTMLGDCIDMAKEAMKVLLKSMPGNCYFNIVGFGSVNHFLFKNGSKKCNSSTLKLGVDYVEKLQAYMGGKELSSALKKVFEMNLIPGYSRQILVITDGNVSNADYVIGLVAANAQLFRLFALGLGSSASHHLIEGIAKSGGGTCAFVEKITSIPKQILKQLKNALQPSLTDIKIEWTGIEQPSFTASNEKTLIGYDKSKCNDDQASTNSLKTHKLLPIFDGSQWVVYKLFDEDLPTGGKITAQSPDGPLCLNLELDEQYDIGSTRMLHRLNAIKTVRALELQESFINGRNDEITFIKGKIIEIAVANGISSRYTSFIAIDEDSKVQNVKDSCTLQRRHVPSQTPQGSFNLPIKEKHNPRKSSIRVRCSRNRLASLKKRRRSRSRSVSRDRSWLIVSPATNDGAEPMDLDA